MDLKSLEACFKQMATEARELHVDKCIQVLDEPPEPLEFYRDYVAANKPVVIRGVARHWPAFRLWNNHDYLRQKIGSKEITATVTPNGYADAVHENKFVMPAERRMQFSDFLDIIDSNTVVNGVFYVQKQNSNLMDEFAELADDVETDIGWTTEALGALPDAVNFWMGSGDAVTSMHKDHYENIYCVVSGHKTFILIPPTDQPFVPYEQYQAAVYTERPDGQFDVVDTDSDNLVPWIAIDPLNPDLARHPQYRFARPLEVTVEAGDALFLPSLWFHHVRQSHGCIAVNFWYDMTYDIRYTYFKFVESLMTACKNSAHKSSNPNHVGDSLQLDSANSDGVGDDTENDSITNCS